MSDLSKYLTEPLPTFDSTLRLILQAQKLAFIGKTHNAQFVQLELCLERLERTLISSLEDVCNVSLPIIFFETLSTQLGSEADTNSVIGYLIDYQEKQQNRTIFSSASRLLFGSSSTRNLNRFVSELNQFIQQINEAITIAKQKEEEFYKRQERGESNPLTDITIREALSLWGSNQSLAIEQYDHISYWDTSQVTDMKDLFKTTSSHFNDDIRLWNVSNVTDMSKMFAFQSEFNRPLNTWNVCHVTNMSGMFWGASAFNQSLSNWNVSNVTNMNSMFWSASSFDQSLDNWNVSNVTDMSLTFRDASKFNQPLGNWNVSKVTNMNHMFECAIEFNQPLADWDVSNVTSMAFMFDGASAFNQSIANWNVSNVTSCSYIFNGSSSSKQYQLAPKFK